MALLYNLRPDVKIPLAVLSSFSLGDMTNIYLSQKAQQWWTKVKIPPTPKLVNHWVYWVTYRSMDYSEAIETTKPISALVITHESCIPGTLLMTCQLEHLLSRAIVCYLYNIGERPYGSSKISVSCTCTFCLLPELPFLSSFQWRMLKFGGNCHMIELLGYFNFLFVCFHMNFRIIFSTSMENVIEFW